MTNHLRIFYDWCNFGFFCGGRLHLFDWRNFRFFHNKWLASKTNETKTTRKVLMDGNGMTILQPITLDMDMGMKTKKYNVTIVPTMS